MVHLKRIWSKWFSTKKAKKAASGPKFAISEPEELSLKRVGTSLEEELEAWEVAVERLSSVAQDRCMMDSKRHESIIEESVLTFMVQLPTKKLFELVSEAHQMRDALKSSKDNTSSSPVTDMAVRAKRAPAQMDPKVTESSTEPGDRVSRFASHETCFPIQDPLTLREVREWRNSQVDTPASETFSVLDSFALLSKVFSTSESSLLSQLPQSRSASQSHIPAIQPEVNIEMESTTVRRHFSDGISARSMLNEIAPLSLNCPRFEDTIPLVKAPPSSRKSNLPSILKRHSSVDSPISTSIQSNSPGTPTHRDRDLAPVSPFKPDMESPSECPRILQGDSLVDSSLLDKTEMVPSPVSDSSFSRIFDKDRSKELAVLLVDDMMSILMQYRRLLGKTGLPVYTARDGREGLCLLKQRKFVVVFMDLSMPIMSGTECVSSFRAWEAEHRREKQFIVALTGEEDFSSSRMNELLSCGFDDVESKPNSKEAILKFVADNVPLL